MSPPALAEDHRRRQATLSGLLARELAAAVGALVGVQLDRGQRRARLLDVFAPLVREYGQASAALAGDFFGRVRDDVGEPGRFEVPLSDPAPDEQVESALDWALRTTTPDGDVDDELVDLDRLDERRATDLAGAGRRLAAQPGRTTLERAIDEDPAAVGWARITDANPCSFCLMLSGRGFVYLERDTALYVEGTREPFHDHDQCTVMPRFRSDRSPLPKVNQQAQDLWYETGAYFTGSDARAAYERAVRARRAGRDVRAAVFEGPATDPDQYRRRITHDRATVEQYRRKAQRGGTNGRPPAERDEPGDPRWPDRRS